MLRYDDEIYDDKCRSCEPSDHRKSYKALNDLNEEIICCNITKPPTGNAKA